MDNTENKSNNNQLKENKYGRSKQRSRQVLRGALQQKNSEDSSGDKDIPLNINDNTKYEDDCELILKEEPLNNRLFSAENIPKYALWSACMALWITLYVVAIELEFGCVYLLLSAIAGIFINTSTKPKDQNHISAYSVFNKNFESIDGTLKAEQIERQFGINS